MKDNIYVEAINRTTAKQRIEFSRDALAAGYPSATESADLRFAEGRVLTHVPDGNDIVVRFSDAEHFGYDPLRARRVKVEAYHLTSLRTNIPIFGLALRAERSIRGEFEYDEDDESVTVLGSDAPAFVSALVRCIADGVN